MFIINAELRKKTGKSFSRKLRTKNKFPGILYGMNRKNILVSLDHDAVFNLQKQTIFYKECLFLMINSEKYEVKVQAVQRHSFKLKLLHIDFLYIKK